PPPPPPLFKTKTRNTTLLGSFRGLGYFFNIKSNNKAGFKALLLNPASKWVVVIEKIKFMGASDLKFGQMTKLTHIIQRYKLQAARDGLTREVTR
ncbi:hypothetical protein ACVGXN_00220, partial [Enterobacter hormaechei]